MKHTYRLLACICLFFLSGQLFAQTATEAYRQKAGNFALAYTGIVEKGYRVGYVNTPYYPTEYTSGSFVYRGVPYTDVKLRNDCHTQRLIMLTPDGKFNRVLHPEEVSRAVIGNTPFVYFDARQATPGEGYYAAIYEGRTSASTSKSMSATSTRRPEEASCSRSSRSMSASFWKRTANGIH
ncbi:MAG: hypothetical protein J6R54_00260 [Bacteroidaceae bacterium]|nr:hypothetical protein [Bacteroidaceae bacterium]